MFSMMFMSNATLEEKIWGRETFQAWAALLFPCLATSLSLVDTYYRKNKTFILCLKHQTTNLNIKN